MSKLFKSICDPLHIEVNKLRYPSFPEKYIPALDIKGRSTNKLEKQIVAFIQLHGWQAERVKNTGTARVSEVELASGYTKKNVTYTKGTGRNGTADISATIEGRSVKIEVKNKKTKDRMSKHQKSYQAELDLTGGIYYVAKEIDEFINWFNDNFSKNPKWEQAVLTTYKK